MRGKGLICCIATATGLFASTATASTLPLYRLLLQRDVLINADIWADEPAILADDHGH